MNSIPNEWGAREYQSDLLKYMLQGGLDSKDDFQLKWNSGEVKTGNIRELREFKEKIISLKN